jgi:hypothetical protein
MYNLRVIVPGLMTDNSRALYKRYVLRSGMYLMMTWSRYNEIWPTGGWGSIEYGSAVPGQVEGGRWKPLVRSTAR